jgi:methionyl-tRNA formyltransferase
MGTPEFAVGSLKALVEGGYNVVGVVTVPDKPSGRGLKVNMSAVKEYALGLNIPIMQPVSLKDPAFLEELEALKGDCFVVVAFRMLPQVVWGMPRLGTFNLHASLLPQYRGAAPINWAIINGETTTGVTTFLLDKQIDTGNILFQQECEIAPDENIGSLYDRLMEMGSALVLRTVDALAEGNITPKPQVESGQLKPAPKITRETCRIDWTQPAQRVVNLI